MRKVSVFFGIFLSIVVVVWITLTDLGGYTSRNAMIIARSTPIVSTIDGEVTFVMPSVGSKVAAGSLLVTIQNNRIDRSHLTELLGKQVYLEWEVKSAETLSKELDTMKSRFAERAAAYWSWMQLDLGILRRQTEFKFLAAEETHAVKLFEIQRQKELLDGAVVSQVVLDLAKSNAAIARHEMEALGAELDRIDLQIAASTGPGTMVREASYWDKASDTAFLNSIESKQKVVSMKAQLRDINEQISVETDRLQVNFAEQHKVPFDGVINAVMTSKDELVTSGTTLLEVLDCTNPIAIVSIPEHRIGDFFTGQKAIISPLDSGDDIMGTVQHISSGPLISRDTTIAAHPDLMLDGNKVIVAFDNDEQASVQGHSCDTARRAVVTIETDTLLGSVGGMMASLFDDFEVLLGALSPGVTEVRDVTS